MVIYCDHNAATQVDSRVLELMQGIYLKGFANPGSAHAAGREARKILDESREKIAKIIDCLAEEIVFTSGGTESANLALYGLLQGQLSSKEGRVILAMPGQHPSSRETLRKLAIQSGCRLLDIPLDADGQIDSTRTSELPWNETIMVSAIHGHNETGVIAKLETIKLKCLEYKILWHVDGVQSVGRLAISFHNLGANALSFGAHKFGGPRGVGGLIIKQGTQFTPLMSGGFQEASRRPGTENPVLAAGMARALELWWKERQVRYSHLLALRNRFEEGLHKLSETKGLRFNITGEDVERLPNTSNVTFDGVDGEALLVALDLRGVCCSMGSACASGSPEPAPVLLAMGYAEKDARSTLRFSFGMTNTPDEIDQLLTILGEVLSTMNAMDRAK